VETFAVTVVDVEAGRHERGLGAQPAGLGHGHGRAHAVPTGLVIGRSHHATVAGPPHHYRAAPQPRFVPRLDRGIKGVHVRV
jgi:hypothetical protein